MRYAALIFLLAAGICRAEEACPWMNAATAAGILGGEVISHYDGSTCLFTHSASQLVIKVQTVTLPYKLTCAPNPMSLKAIGNEAIACSPDEKNGHLSEQVVGRVRDRVFVLRISVAERAAARDSLRDKARAAADLVSGNLF